MNDRIGSDFERRFSDQLSTELDDFVRPFDAESIVATATRIRPSATRRRAVLMVGTVALAALLTLAGIRLVAPVPSIDVGALPIAWPPLPADPALTATARTWCLTANGLDPNLPLLFQDRRSPDLVIVIFRNGSALATCEFERHSDGTTSQGASIPSDPWNPQQGAAVGSAGLSIQQAAAPGDPGNWSYLMGTAPQGAASIRLAVEGKQVDAVMVDGIYSIGWLSPEAPTLLVAYDAAGAEIDRIDRSDLDRIFRANPCDPLSVGACP